MIEMLPFPWLVCTACLLALTVLFAVQGRPAAAGGFAVAAGERQLFLDDVGIAEREHLQRVMHQPAKKGAVIRPDRAAGVHCVQVRTAPVWDPEAGLFKFWDCAAEPPELHAEGTAVTGYYESRDGLHWARPNLGLIAFRDNRDNNYTNVVHEGRCLRLDYVAYDPTDPDPQRRYKAAMPPEGFAASPDGIHWRMLDIPGIASGDEANFSFDQKAHLFLLTVKRDGLNGRSVHLETSADFETWTNHGLVFHADDLDQQLFARNLEARLADPTLHQPVANDPAHHNVDVYNMGLFRYEGLYIGMPAMYHATGPADSGPNTDGFHLVQLVCSRDLKTWQRLGERQPFIGPSRTGSGAYDQTQIMPPSSAVVHGDELWFYYTGAKYRRLPPRPDPDVGAICLAVLRRDGFIGLAAGAKAGTVLTDPFTVPGTALVVNLDAGAGELTVQALDASGAVVAGSEPLSGDHAQQTVEWQKGSLAALEGRTASLRFTLRNAELFSYWIR